MGTRAFQEWVDKEQLSRSGDLSSLKGSVIGVDAMHFVKQFLSEPLLTALDGPPIALDSLLKPIDSLQEAGITLHFVFDGLQTNEKDDAFACSDFLQAQIDTAFSQYESQQPESVIRVFQGLVTAKLNDYMATVRLALQHNGISCSVAPYSALAQLSYLESNPKEFIDAVYGPPELFLFGLDKMITSFPESLSLDQSGNKTQSNDRSDDKGLQFCWLDKVSCTKALGNIDPNIFREALIILGSDYFLPTFPPLLSSGLQTKGLMLTEITNLLLTARGSVLSLCAQYNDPDIKDRWLPLYQKVRTAIKFQVILTASGEIECLNAEEAPRDLHLCIGLRLPEELYFYLSKGLIHARVLSAVVRSEIVVPAPLAGGEIYKCQAFEKLRLFPVRKQAICLITNKLHRYFQRADYSIRFWFDRSSEEKFKPVNFSQTSSGFASIWQRLSLLTQNNLTSPVESGVLRSTLQCIHGVRPVELEKTQHINHDVQKLINSRSAISATCTLHFLQLRGFLDSSYELTQWGRVLLAALEATKGQKEQEEAVFLALEMIRFGALGVDDYFHSYSGVPTRGSAKEQSYCLLISRVASVGKLRHKSIGYCGPLSRSLLAFHAMVSGLQNVLRDLLEMDLAATFLDGGIERARDDWTELATSLPFHENSSCSLGIAVMTYLDHLELNGEPNMQETHSRTRQNAQGWIQHSNLDESLERAFEIWDAVYVGVQAAGDLIPDKLSWESADNWLKDRR